MEGIIGTIYKHDDDTYSIWVGDLSKEDENKISEILSKYETEGMSVRGRIQDISLTEVVNTTSTYDKVREILDEIYNSSETLNENFGDEICQEITEYLTDNDYDINRKMVEEAIQWCYICQMQ